MTRNTLKITFPWWFRLYLCLLIYFCGVFGTLPDWDKLDRLARRAMKVGSDDA